MIHERTRNYHQGSVIIFRLGKGGRGLWGSHDFQGERSGEQSSLTEYKGGTRKLTGNEGDQKNTSEP